MRHLSARLLLAALLCAIPSVAPAQVNAERFRDGAAEEGFNGQIELSYANRTGNTDLLSAGATIHLGWKKGSNTILAVADGAIGEQRADTTIKKGFVHLRGVRRVHPRVAMEVFAQQEYDGFANLIARTLAGTGPRFTLGEGAHWGVYLGIAYMRERERLKVVPPATDNPLTLAHRGSSYLAANLKLADRVSLSNTVYAQPRLDEARDLRILEELALTVGMTDKLALKISLSVRHDDAPPTGVKSTDTAFSNRLVLSF